MKIKYLVVFIILLMAFVPTQAKTIAPDELPWTYSNGCWTYTSGSYTWVKLNTTTDLITTNGSWKVPGTASSLEFLVIAGGGSGATGAFAGGGGAGGVLNGTMSVTPGSSIFWQVGKGGLVNGTTSVAIGQRGTNSSLNGLQAYGGGHGGAYDVSLTNGGDGGSGGGAGGYGGTGGTATSGQGNNGGGGIAYGGTGGGGGSGGTGGTASSDSASGNGGVGTAFYITGTPIVMAAGGGGGGYSNTTAGGAGGGGTGGKYDTSDPTPGLLGSGSGGGGAGGGTKLIGAAGGDGVIFIKYLSATLTSAFTSNTTQFVTPQTVEFTVTSAVTPDTVKIWWGDDTTTSVAGTPTTTTATHAYYSNSSTYSPMVVTSAIGYNDSVTTNTNYIKTLPKISNWIQPVGNSPTEHTFQPIALQSTTNFTSQYGPNSYVWTFDNGTVSWTQSGLELQTTYWNFTKIGTYDLSLNVTNPYGTNITTVQNYITIVDIPTPTSLITSDIQYTNTYPVSIIFNDTGIDEHVDSWLWTWGDGNQYYTIDASAKNRTYVYNTTGTFEVSLTKTNALGSYTNSTPTDYINIQYPTLSVTNSPSYANRNLTGMFTIAGVNISRAKEIGVGFNYNFTQINITSISLNSSASGLGLSLAPGYSTPGTVTANITNTDISIPTTTNIIDVKYLVKDMTNYSSTLGYPWMPINIEPTQSYIWSNTTTYQVMMAYPPATTVSGYAAFTNSTFSKTIKFYNNVNNQKITGQTLTVQWIPSTGAGSAGSGTTTTGEYTITSSYDPSMSVTGAATGYYNGTATYVWSNTNTESQFITPLSGASGSTVWYTPKQVRFRVMDGNNNPLPYTTVSADFIASTLPSTDPTWLQTAYGISRSVATDMMNSAQAMTGITGKDGYITFTMHGSLQYNMSVTNTTSGVYGWYESIYPMDNEYLLRVSNSFANNQVSSNSFTYVQNTTLWMQELTGSVIRLGLNFTDTSGQSTNVKFMVWDAINGTVYNTNTSAAPGTNLYQPYFDLPNVRGNKYLWNYSAVRP